LQWLDEQFLFLFLLWFSFRLEVPTGAALIQRSIVILLFSAKHIFQSATLYIFRLNTFFKAPHFMIAADTKRLLNYKLLKKLST
jgi:hypothetical protein